MTGPYDDLKKWWNEPYQFKKPFTNGRNFLFEAREAASVVVILLIMVAILWLMAQMNDITVNNLKCRLVAPDGYSIVNSWDDVKTSSCTFSSHGKTFKGSYIYDRNDDQYYLVR